MQHVICNKQRLFLFKVNDLLFKINIEIDQVQKSFTRKLDQPY